MTCTRFPKFQDNPRKLRLCVCVCVWKREGKTWKRRSFWAKEKKIGQKTFGSREENQRAGVSWAKKYEIWSLFLFLYLYSTEIHGFWLKGNQLFLKKRNQPPLHNWCIVLCLYINFDTRILVITGKAGVRMRPVRVLCEREGETWKSLTPNRSGRFLSSHLWHICQTFLHWKIRVFNSWIYVSYITYIMIINLFFLTNFERNFPIMSFNLVLIKWSCRPLIYTY